ncbi:MAG: acyltransferase [Rhodoferax sp.]
MRSAIPSDNGWDALRLGAALMVLVSHQFVLLGQPQPSVLGCNTLGGLGVAVFFLLSGGLIWQSWARDPHLGRFVLRRALRLWPALAGVVLLSMCVLGPALSTLSLRDYAQSRETWRYLGTAVLAIQYQLPGLFDALPFAGVVNGSIWTLPVEAVCYLALAGLGLLGFPRRAPLLALAGLLLALPYGALVLGQGYAAHVELVSLFAWGMGYAIWRNLPARQRAVGAGWALAVLVLDVARAPRGLERAVILLLAALLIAATAHWPAAARVTRRVGDLSYGTYLYAFPVQQTVIAMTQDQRWPMAWQMAASVGLTLALAALSWHLLEAPALAHKPTRPSTGGAHPASVYAA